MKMDESGAYKAVEQDAYVDIDGLDEPGAYIML
jgi:hypothetical protein